MAHKQLTRSTSTLISILAFLAILSAVNVFLFRNYVRKDLTANRMFTVTDATKALFSKMKDDVNVTVYASENLPPDLQTMQRFAREFLTELRGISGGKLTLRFEVPKDDKETEQALARKGIQREQVNVLQKDELKVAAVYYHVLLQHLDKYRVIPFPNPQTIEYDMASALLEVTQSEKPVIAFVTNDPEFRFSDLLFFLRDRMKMGDRYDIRELKIKDTDALDIPRECKTLVLVKPKNFKETDLYKIDQFVMGGGTLVVFAQAVDFQNPMAMFQPSPPPNVIPLLERYGLKVNSDMVSDYKSSAMRQVPAGRSGIFTIMADVQYPQWVVATREGFDKDNPALKSLQNLLLPYPNSIEFSGMLPEGAQKFELIRTSEKSARQEKPPFELQPPDPREFKVPDNTQSYLVAAGVSGPLESYYKDKEKPKADDAEADKEKDPLQHPPEEDSAPKLDQARDGRVIVISSAQFLDADFLRQVGGQIIPQTLVFIENMVDWLTLGTDLISIRTKPIQMHKIRPELKDEEKFKAKFLGRFAVPILIVLAGIGWWFFRRNRINHLAELYTQPRESD